MYFQSNTLLLLVYLRTLQICLKICKLGPAKFLSATGLAWQAALKRTKVKLGLLNDINMLLMVEKGIRRGICHSIFWYAKANTNTWKIMIKINNYHIFIIGLINNLHGWAMSQKPSINNFEWIKDTSQFNEDFMKNYNKESDEWYFLEVDVQYLEK